MRKKLFLGAAISLILVGSVSACSGFVPSAPTDPSSKPVIQGDGTLRIFAAASLTESFAELVAKFQEQHPGVKIAPVNFDGSATLATQINEGAPADIFASADSPNMQAVASEIDGDTEFFASNVMEIAVSPGNPSGIRSIRDLEDPKLQVVVCASAVPCGALALKIFGLAGVTVKPVSEEQNVRAVLAKVEAREADAGLVYATDVASTKGSVEGVAISIADQVRNKYPIATMKGADPIAKKFVEFVLSNEGQAILKKYGFGSA